MSFGNKRLDRAFDRWITQTPEEYYGLDEEYGGVEMRITEIHVKSKQSYKYNSYEVGMGVEVDVPIDKAHNLLREFASLQTICRDAIKKEIEKDQKG